MTCMFPVTFRPQFKVGEIMRRFIDYKLAHKSKVIKERAEDFYDCFTDLHQMRMIDLSNERILSFFKKVVRTDVSFHKGYRSFAREKTFLQKIICYYHFKFDREINISFLQIGFDLTAYCKRRGFKSLEKRKTYKTDFLEQEKEKKLAKKLERLKAKKAQKRKNKNMKAKKLKKKEESEHRIKILRICNGKDISIEPVSKMVEVKHA